MTARKFLELLKRRWILTVSCVLLGVLVAGLTVFLRPASYVANITMYVSAQASSENPTAAYQGGLLSEQRVRSYTTLVTGPRVTAQVVRELGLAYTPAQISEKLTASSPTESTLLDVKVEDPSPQLAADIANSIGRIFPTLVAELERPAQRNAAPSVVVRTIEPAAVPAEPANSGAAAIILIGALLGVALGILAAALRDSLDVSVRSADAMSSSSDSPALAEVSEDSRYRTNPVIRADESLSGRQEDFRRLRTALQFIAVDSNKRSFVVTSSVPGEGKSISACNLAVALASAGERVLLIDGDMRRSKLAEYLGLESAAGLSNVLAGQVEFEAVAQHVSSLGITFLASGVTPPNPGELLASQQMRIALQKMTSVFDKVIIDTPPLLAVADASAVGPLTSGAILVCKYGSTSYHQIERSCSLLRAGGTSLVGSVLTHTPPAKEKTYGGYYDSVASNMKAARMTPARQNQEASTTTTTTLHQEDLDAHSQGLMRSRHSSDRNFS